MAGIRGFSLAKIANIRVAFATFDSRMTSAREFLRRVSAAGVRETNTKCQVTSDISGSSIDPTVDITFSDGSKMHFDAAQMKALEMIGQVNQKSRTL